MDIVVLLLIIAFSFASVALIDGCERLRRLS